MSAVCRQLIAAVSVSIALLIVGTALAWPSPVILQITKTGQPFNMTHDEIALMVSFIYAGNILSPLPTGFLMEAIGRKSTLIYLSIVPLSSWIVTYFSNSSLHLCIARFLAGAWLGTVSTVVPLYVAEISDPRFRGAFSTFFQMMTNTGVFFAYYIGSKVGYYTFTYILGIIPLIFMISFAFMPESPYWHIKRGRHEKAVQSLSWLRAKKPEEVKEELAEIEVSVTRKLKKRMSILELFRDRSNRKALLIVEVIAVVQRTSGISGILAYASTTLPEGGTGTISVNDSITIMGGILTISVFISTFLIDRLGRRPLLLTSCFGCGMSMFISGLWYFLDSNIPVDVSSFSWIPFAFLNTFCIFFSVGIGPLATTIQGELFPSAISGIASGFTAIILASVSFFMNLIYIRIADMIGMYCNFWIFALACFFGTGFVYRSVIETKGKSLYQIQREMNDVTERIKKDVIIPL